MFRNSQSFFLVALSLFIPAGTLFVTGCGKSEAPPTEGGAPGDRMGGGPGGPGGGRMQPVAADAKAADIFQMKCAGCHGDKGQGVKGPDLTKVSAEPDDKLFKTIHNGKGRMPAFSSQMTDSQITELVAYVKGLGK